MEQSILTVKEAAAIVRISPSKMYQLVREGVVPHVKLGHRSVIPKARLLTWIEQSVQGGRA